MPATKRKGTIVDESDTLADVSQDASELGKIMPEPEEVELNVIAEDEEEFELNYDEEGLSIEDMEDDEELFPDGPKGAELKAWKSQYKEIYVTVFDDDNYVVWRTMNRFEYRRIVKNLEQSVATGAVSQAEASMNNEEAICELCVLYPRMLRTENTSFLAGMATVIAQGIMEASAFVPLEVRKL